MKSPENNSVYRLLRISEVTLKPSEKNTESNSYRTLRLYPRSKEMPDALDSSIQLENPWSLARSWVPTVSTVVSKIACRSTS